jgi:hypothetical protein
MKQMGRADFLALKERGKWMVAHQLGKQGGDHRGGHGCWRQALAVEQRQRTMASRLDSTGTPADEELSGVDGWRGMKLSTAGTPMGGVRQPTLGSGRCSHL